MTQNIYYPVKPFVVFHEVHIKIVQPIEIQKGKLLLFCIFDTAFGAHETRQAAEDATAARAPSFAIVVVRLQ